MPLAEFADALAAAWADQGVEAALVDAISERLDNMNRATLQRAAAYKAGVLVQVNLDPAGIGHFGDDILAHTHTVAGATFADTLDDSAEYRDAVFMAVNALRTQWVAVENPKPISTTTTPKRAEEEEEDGVHSAYAELKKHQSRPVELTDRLTFVGKAMRDLARYGFMNDLPSLNEARCMGVHQRKAKHQLATADGGTGLELTLGDLAGTGLPNLETCRDRARQYVYALLAIFSKPIKTEAYQGREAGWVQANGGQMRLLGTAPVFERLLWKIVSVPCTDVDSFVRMFDGLMTHFLKRFARLVDHPDELVETMLEGKGQLFDCVAVKGSVASADDAVSNYTQSSLQTPEKAKDSEAGIGLCGDWIKSGKCSDRDCKASHKTEDRSAFSKGGGGGAKRQRGGRGGGWSNDWSGWGDNNWGRSGGGSDWGWNSGNGGNSRRNSSKGKGSGKGGKGAGGKGNKGGKNNGWSWW